MMKKAMWALLLICLVAAMCACSSRNAAISSGTAASEKEERVEEPARQAADPNRFYKARTIPEEGVSYIGYSAWSNDGSFWVQDLNTIHLIDRSNALMKTVVLDESQLPPMYRLVWNENKILAIRTPAEDSQSEFGAVLQADGKISLCGVSIWDTDGHLVKEYPSFPLRGDAQEMATTPAGKSVDWQSNLYDGTRIFWLDDHTIAINAHSRVILYDLESDTGRVVDEMVELVEKYGKFGVYFGVESFSCYVSNGNFYYLAHKNDEETNRSGTIWRVGKDDAKASLLFDGKEFSHLYVDGNIMVLGEIVDTPEYGYNLWWADAQQGVLNEMGFFKISIPIVIEEQRILMRADSPELYCFDTALPKEEALTVVPLGDCAVRDLQGLRLSSAGELQILFSASSVTKEDALDFYLLDVKSGKKTCVYEGYLYDQLLLSPDKSGGAILSTGAQNNTPQARIIPLER